MLEKVRSPFFGPLKLPMIYGEMSPETRQNEDGGLQKQTNQSIPIIYPSADFYGSLLKIT